MEIYVALMDSPGRKSFVVGAFSSEEKARAACQENYDEDNETSGMPEKPLEWKDDTAKLDDGDSYVVVLADLDYRVW